MQKPCSGTVVQPLSLAMLSDILKDWRASPQY
jgi:hypothetical protein